MGVLVNNNGNLEELTNDISTKTVTTTDGTTKTLGAWMNDVKPRIDERVTDLENRTTELENIDIPEAATEAPQAPGEASVGTSEKYARADHVHPEQDIPEPATVAPKALGTATVGTSKKYAREDHVHPSDTSSGVVSTIIYPNGGSAGAEANVTNDQRIEMDNPFPGYFVQCEAQIKYNNKWGATGWFTDYSNVGNYCGVRATLLMPDDKIIIQTGVRALLHYSSAGGDPFGKTTLDFSVLSAPCRVIVTLLGKIPD